MALQLAGLLGGLQQGFVAQKVAAVQSGQKVVKPPKTIFGKAFGRLTGRTQAAEAQKQIQEQKIQTNMITTPVGSRGSQLSGGISFGQQAQTAKLPIYALVGAVIVAGFYFFSPRKRRGRR